MQAEDFLLLFLKKKRRAGRGGGFRTHVLPLALPPRVHLTPPARGGALFPVQVNIYDSTAIPNFNESLWPLCPSLWLQELRLCPPSPPPPLRYSPSLSFGSRPLYLWRFGYSARARPKWSEAILLRHQRVAGDLACCAACGDYTSGGRD